MGEFGDGRRVPTRHVACLGLGVLLQAGQTTPDGLGIAGVDDVFHGHVESGDGLFGELGGMLTQPAGDAC